jgi:hypothetical protein
LTKKRADGLSLGVIKSLLGGVVILHKRKEIGIETGIVALGSKSFRAINYNMELLEDGLNRMMWTVTFILNNEVVVTTSCESPGIALSVAITAKKGEL